MHPSPAIVELRKGVSCQEIDKLEEVVGLCKDKKVINLVNKPIPDVNCVKDDNEPTKDVSEVSEPTSHEIVVGVSRIHTVESVDQMITIFILELRVKRNTTISIWIVWKNSIFTILRETLIR